VVDLGSISAAARSENLSLAVASKRIQRLEESLGPGSSTVQPGVFIPPRKGNCWHHRGGR
jgi:hypothetical protein